MFDVYFSDRVHWISSDVLWIPGYLSAQFKTLSKTNKAHINMAKKVLSLVGNNVDNFNSKTQVAYNMLLDLIDSPEGQESPDSHRIQVIGYRIQDKNTNKVDWKNEAELCFQAARKFPNSDSLALNWLGPSREAYVKELGGIQFFRSVKHTDFEATRVGGLIKNAWEMISSGESA